MLKTMTLLALVMLTSAAPADDKRELAASNDKRELNWWNNYFQNCRHGRRLEAKIKQPVGGSFFDITIVGKEDLLDINVPLGTKTRGVKWQVIKDDHSVDIAAPYGVSGYNWHIHTKPINYHSTVPDERCGPTTTSGHTDNGFACGGASEWFKTTCAEGLTYGGVGASEAARKLDYSNRCKKCTPAGQLTTDCKGCEYGDLSGKLGKIPLMTATHDFPFDVSDTHIEPIETYKTMSIVVHGCRQDGAGVNCADRVACGDIEYHPY